MRSVADGGTVRACLHASSLKFQMSYLRWRMMKIRARTAPRDSAAGLQAIDRHAAGLPVERRGAKGVGDRARQMVPSAQDATLRRSAVLTELGPDPARYERPTTTMEWMRRSLIQTTTNRRLHVRSVEFRHGQLGAARRGANSSARAQPSLTTSRRCQSAPEGPHAFASQASDTSAMVIGCSTHTSARGLW